MCQPITTVAGKRFKRQCQVATATSLILYLVCSQLSLHLHTGLLSLVLAGLSGAFFFAELVSFGTLVFGIRDEFQRILLTRAFLAASLITMAFTTVWGFVELHAHGSVPHLHLLAIPLMLILLTTAAKVFIFRQYRSPSE